MTDPFCNRLAIDRIRDGERLDLVAGDEERRAIAKRFDLLSLGRLEASAALEREGPRIRALGRIRAELEQSCVATGEPVREIVDEPFDILFVPEPAASATDEEIELSGDECDTVFYAGGAIDLGSAIADTLALAIDPYPRSPGADAVLQQAGVLSEGQSGPFAVLAKLKKGRGEG